MRLDRGKGSDGVRLPESHGILAAPAGGVPVIKGWNRLEGRPGRWTSNVRCAPRYETRLWFLTRQWQFGEFQGEDAASPVEVRTVVQGSSLTSYSPAGRAAISRPLPTCRWRRGSSASRYRADLTCTFR